MPTINANFNFNLEDKVTWEELAPSLQDKFKELWNKLNATNAWLDDRLGDIRITIDYDPPTAPVEYNELWFDLRYMVARAYVKGDWVLTRGAWYGKEASTVTSTPEAPLSTNDRTNCHCYAVDYGLPSYCHCKSQMWDPSTVPEGQQSNLAFNQNINNPYISTKYQWTIKCNMDSVNIQTLNATTEEDPNVNAIIPMNIVTNVPDSNGGSSPYCTFDSKYDPIFDGSTSTSYVFNTGTTTIPITFAQPIKLTNIFGRLAPYSNGPVTITFYVFVGSSYQQLAQITLAGNPQYAITCHNACHCARW